MNQLTESSDARTRAIGRAGRDLTPALTAWFRNERAADADPHDMGWALSSVLAHAIGGFAHEAARAGREPATAVQTGAQERAWVEFMLTEIRTHALELLGKPEDCPGCARPMQAGRR